MRNLNFLKLFYGLMLVMLSTAYTSCVDDNDDTEAPFLEVSPTTLNFGSDGQPANGSQASFTISTNRAWKATVPTDKSWVTLSQEQGEGTATIEVSIPEGINDEATVTIEISNKVGVLMSEAVTIKSGNLEPTVLIYKETFGTEGTAEYPYPFVDTYQGWVKTGEGSSTVEYTGKAASLRNKSNASDGYEGASGSTKLFFGNTAEFVINKITLKENQKNLMLNFGGAYYDGTTKDDVFKPEQFHVYLSANGTTWTPINYTTTEAKNGWIYATANFTLKNSVEFLYIKFTADIASMFSLDDPSLSTGNGSGQMIDLGNGGSVDPGEAIEISIPDLIAKMTNDETDVDQSYIIKGIICGDPKGLNYSKGTLYIMTEGATSAGNGLALYSTDIDATNYDLGDALEVTLKKGVAKIYKRFGIPQANAFKATDIKVNAKNKTVTPIPVTIDQLSAYLSMPVIVKDVTVTEAGIWMDSDKNTTIKDKFFVGSTPLQIYFNYNAAAIFVNQTYGPAQQKSLTGIASIYQETGQIMPRNLEDVKEFNSSTPLITEVTPTSVIFPASGGSKTIEVKITNQGNNKLSTSGLSEAFTVAVNENIITITAVENNGREINETLTISLENGNSKTVSITQEAKSSTGGGDEIVMTKDDIINGKTGDVALATNGYGKQNVNDVSTWYTWNTSNFNFTGARICIAPENNGSGIQVQGNASDATKQGRIGNVTAISNIQTIEIVLRVAAGNKNDPSYNVYAGTSANPTNADNKITGTSSVETVGDFRVYTQTFDLSTGNYNYFNIVNDLVGALYIDSIKITYKK